jgi:hypothetical protein
MNKLRKAVKALQQYIYIYIYIRRKGVRSLNLFTLFLTISEKEVVSI